jgi:hypothetical protein
MSVGCRLGVACSRATKPTAGNQINAPGPKQPITRRPRTCGASARSAASVALPHASAAKMSRQPGMAAGGWRSSPCSALLGGLFLDGLVLSRFDPFWNNFQSDQALDHTSRSHPAPPQPSPTINSQPTHL